MSSSLLNLVDAVPVLAAVVILLLAGYKAFLSRRVLIDPAYRSWAVWTAILALLAIPFEVNLIRLDLGVELTGLARVLWGPVVALAGLLFGLAWLDRTIRISLDLDFFHRDILYWQRVGRVVTLVAIVVSAIGFWGFNFTALGIVTLVLLAYPFAVLALSIRRAHEVVLLNYIRWVAMVVVSAIAATVFGLLTGYNFLTILPAYFLYRASGSLSGSIYHLELEWLYKAPRDVVYAFSANPENMTKLTRAFRSAKYVGKDSEGRDIVEATAVLFGKELKGTLKRRPIPPDRLEEEAITDAGTSSTIFVFTEKNGVTHVRASIDVEPTSAMAKLFGGFGVSRIRKQFQEDSEIGRAYLEADKSL